MIENYLFDLYGTLVDIRTDESMPSLWRRMALVLSLQGAAYDPEELQIAYHTAVQTEIDRCWTKTPSVPREHIEPDILRAFASLYVQKGVVAGHDRLIDAAIFFRAASMLHLRLYPRAQQVLRALRQRGRGVYLLSNAQAAFTEPELQSLGLTPLFDGIVLSSDAGVKKPDEAIFHHIFAKYHLRPDTCLMVGNDEEADMLGASRVGMAGVYIHTKQSPERRRPLPDGCREIVCLSDLLEE